METIHFETPFFTYVSGILFLARVIVSWRLITLIDKPQYSMFDFSFENLPDKFSIMVRSYFGFYFWGDGFEKLKKVNNWLSFLWLVGLVVFSIFHYLKNT